MIRLIYTLLMSALAVFVCYSMTTRAWLQTDLTELLPQSSQDQQSNHPACRQLPTRNRISDGIGNCRLMAAKRDIFRSKQPNQPRHCTNPPRHRQNQFSRLTRSPTAFTDRKTRRLFPPTRRRCRQPVCRIPPALRRGLAGFRAFRCRQNQSPNPSAMASRKRYAVQRRQRKNLGLDTCKAARQHPSSRYLGSFVPKNTDIGIRQAHRNPDRGRRTFCSSR